MMSSLSYRTMSSFILEDQVQSLRSYLENDHVNIDDRDENGQTVLILAAEQGKYEIVRELIKQNADINAEDNDNWTALLIAAKEGHSKIVSILLENNAEIEHKDMNGWTALLWSCYKGHIDIAKILLNASADPNAHGQYNISCLSWAAGRNRTVLVKELLAYGAKVNQSDKYGTTPLVWACRKGHIEIVGLLLKAGANVDTAGMFSWTPLLVATSGNFTEVVLLLLDHKPNVNSIDKDGCTPLTIACKLGNNVIVKSLLSCGAYVNIVDRGGDTNLIHAVKGGHSEVVSSLIQRYADVNIQGGGKKTALYWATEKSNTRIAKILLSANPDIDSPNVDGDTPLMRATRSRAKELVQILLDKNAKVQAVDKKGDTALHIAMRSQSKGIVEVLLRNPKNSKLLYRSNKNGETPYSLDSAHHKSVLANIFGARRLNTNEDSENLLGYDLYSSCLADILSEPSLSMPISVGLYARWGSGKSFLLNKLQDEMKTFSTQVINHMFTFSWPVVLLSSQVSVLVGIVVGILANSLLAGLITGVGVFLLILALFGIVWFGCSKYDWSWCYEASILIDSKLRDWKLLFEILFCHPPNKRREWQMQSIRFLFTSQTKTSCSGSQMSVNQIIRSLHEAVEMEWGKLIPRLHSVFRPATVDSGKRTFRRTCFVPTFLIVATFYICFVSSIIVFSFYFKNINVTYPPTVENHNSSSTTGPETDYLTFSSPPTVFLLIMACVIVLLFLINFLTLINICTALFLPSRRRHRFYNSGSQHNKVKADGYLQEVRKEVVQISGLVRCMEGFTGRKTRIVIVIDGLDSCEQDKVLNMLDTVRLLFSDQNSPFVTLLAIDPHVIVKAIESNIKHVLNDSTINGHDYMKNIIHLPFYLQNSALRGVEVARLTSQNYHKSSIVSTDDNFIVNHRDSVISNISINDSFRSKAVKLHKLNENVSTFGPSSTFSKRVHGAQDLTKVLLNDDYFSDVNPRSMRRLMNVVYVTGRLMKAFNIDFNWYHMASWINITEQWPYRTSWIIFYYENHEELEDSVSLKYIYEKVSSEIPSSKEAEPMLEIDRNGRKFEVFLKYHASSLKVAELKIFRPFTINLDPYILKVIKENVKNVEESRKLESHALLPQPGLIEPPSAFMPMGNMRNRKVSQHKMPFPAQYNNNPYMYYGPPNMPLHHQHMLHSNHSAESYFSTKKNHSSKLFDIPEDKNLSDMSTEDVCELLGNIRGITEAKLQMYRTHLTDNNISGLVLLSCELPDLKDIIKMSFGDWELFKQMIIALKERELSASSVESINALPDDKNTPSSHFVKNQKTQNQKVLESDKKKVKNKNQDVRDDIKTGDQLTKQVTLEETMIFGALQTLNDEAKEDALEVQRYQDQGSSMTVQKHPGYSSTLSNIGPDKRNNEACKETEVLYLTSPPSSPKFSRFKSSEQEDSDDDTVHEKKKPDTRPVPENLSGMLQMLTTQIVGKALDDGTVKEKEKEKKKLDTGPVPENLSGMLQMLTSQIVGKTLSNPSGSDDKDDFHIV